MRSAVLTSTIHPRARVYDVGEDTGRAQEYIVVAGDTRIDAHIVLNLHVVP
jgi:hypothetical protein